MKIKFDPLFEIGQIVYLKTDPDQLGRMCTGYIIRATVIVYYLTYIGSETSHYDYEITQEPDALRRMGVHSGDEIED